MLKAVPEENTKFGAEIKFVGVVWTEMRPASTPKDFEKVIIGSFVKK
jgi:uncharacterized protein YbdZ (MbtH family)